jgi:hypothetical protein
MIAIGGGQPSATEAVVEVVRAYLAPLAADRDVNASVKRRERLGGMLSYYHRRAA